MHLTTNAGALHDGLVGGEHYTAARDCTWRIAPAENDGGPLLLTLTNVRLVQGHDTLTVHEGGGELLRSLPLPPGAVDDPLLPDDSHGCGAAAGACLETIVVRRPPALVRFLSAARADPVGGAEQPYETLQRHVATPNALTMARLTAVYYALGNQSAPVTAGRTRPHALAYGEPEGFVPRVEREAAEWTPDMHAEPWPGSPATWRDGGGAAVVEPDGTTTFLDVGDNYNFYYQYTQ